MAGFVLKFYVDCDNTAIFMRFLGIVAQMEMMNFLIVFSFSRIFQTPFIPIISYFHHLRISEVDKKSPKNVSRLNEAEMPSNFVQTIFG